MLRQVSPLPEVYEQRMYEGLKAMDTDQQRGSGRWSKVNHKVNWTKIITSRCGLYGDGPAPRNENARWTMRKFKHGFFRTWTYTQWNVDGSEKTRHESYDISDLDSTCGTRVQSLKLRLGSQNLHSEKSRNTFWRCLIRRLNVHQPYESSWVQIYSYLSHIDHATVNVTGGVPPKTALKR